LASEIIRKKMCPLIISDTDGTPDLKFMGIFSENRFEWVVAELACCSDSVCIVPLVNQDEFANEQTVANIIDKTKLLTICVSNSTIDLIFKLRKKG
jgi:long-subunit acyl-CoA synthetase (AMP-forming)